MLEEAFREKRGEGTIKRIIMAARRVGGRHLDQHLWRIGVRSVSLALSLANGFHEKAFCVKVNVVSEAQTKVSNRERLSLCFHSL